MSNITAPTKPNVVLGRVTNTSDQPLPNLLVQIYDRDMRTEVMLAETTTSKDGKYETTWLHSQLVGRNRKDADISIKVLTKEKKTLLFTSDIHSVRFNASPREEINITIQAEIKPEVIEYDYILGEVSFLADKVPITDLQKTKEKPDITFLSRETEISTERIEYLVVSHRLQAISKIDAAFFYALLRKNTLLKADLSKAFRVRLSIDMSTDAQTLLYDAALADPKLVQTDIDTAVKEMIVSEKVGKESQRNIGLLQRYRKQADEYYKSKHAQKAFDAISGFVLGGKIEAAVRLFTENKDNLNVFFEKITDPSFFKSEADAAGVKTRIELGKLFGFGSDVIPQVAGSKIDKAEDIKELARLNKTGWVEELEKAAGNNGLEAGNTEAIGLTASHIVRKMEKEFPTTAFAAQLEREKQPVFFNQEKIVSFLNSNKDFDLTRDNIDLFIKESKSNGKETESMKEELKSVQRVFRIIPHYSKANALLEQNIHSAQSIVAAGEMRFVNEIAAKAGIEASEAKEAFRKAEHIHTAAMLVVGELQDTMRAMDIASLETTTLKEKLEVVSKDFPNLKSLFKMTDVCACEHCRSVYSPAAYLVEILQFLSKRSVTDLTVTSPVTGRLAKDVLFKRRPDLGDIDLGCENANTPVKYIDLVCELLEEAVSPDSGIVYNTGPLAAGANPLKGPVSAALLAALQGAGIPVTADAMIFDTETLTIPMIEPVYYLRDKKAVCKIKTVPGGGYKIFRLRQTLSSAEELAAAPEYVNEDAYNALRNNLYAFKLPFDLNHAEARAYFDRFTISRAGLMKAFQVSASPADESIAAEILGITDAERKIIVTPKATAADQQLVWNVPAPWTALDYMKRVDHFLDKTNLTYKELDLLLSLQYIDDAGNLFIRHEYDDLLPGGDPAKRIISCDTGKKEIVNLDIAGLDRIHRFLRLQKKTGWKFEVLDEIICQAALGNKKFDDDVASNTTDATQCLIKAACLAELSERTGIKIDELVGFYGEIPHKVLKDDMPKPLYHQVFLNKARNGFIEEGLLPANVDGTEMLSNYETSVAVCLQLKQQDVKKLEVLLPDNNAGIPVLSFRNLSYLFTASRLIKKLKLKTDDFIILRKLTGLDVSSSPQATLEFIKAVDMFKVSPLKAADLKFMLVAPGALPDNKMIKDEKIKQLLEKLQKDYQANFTLNKSKFNDLLSAAEQKETLQGELSKLNGVTEEDVKTFIAFIDRDWALADEAKAIVIATFPRSFPVTTINSAIDALEAAGSMDYDSKKNNLIDIFINAIGPSVALTGINLNEKQTILQTRLINTGFLNNNEIVRLISFIDRIPVFEAKQFAEDKLAINTTGIKEEIDLLWPALKTQHVK
ncbi:MAG: carboxypeptidase-like regulatory domain-containing protein, partial [Chitinophagaceae bacterium]